MTQPITPSYAGHRFPPEVTGHAVRLYFRFPLGLRTVGPWYTDQRGGRTDPDPRPGSRDADGLRAAEFEHAIQGMRGGGDLGRPTRIGARAQRAGSGNLDRGDEWSFCLTAARMAAGQERRCRDDRAGTTARLSRRSWPWLP